MVQAVEIWGFLALIVEIWGFLALIMLVVSVVDDDEEMADDDSFDADDEFGDEENEFGDVRIETRNGQTRRSTHRRRRRK